MKVLNVSIITSLFPPLDIQAGHQLTSLYMLEMSYRVPAFTCGMSKQNTGGSPLPVFNVLALGL